MRLPSLKYLRTFRTAARYVSFKDAADELCVTASAVSHQVRNLEQFLGIALFERGTRSLRLTDAGARYYAYLDGMFERLESETQQLITDYSRQVIRLCVPDFFASEALLPCLSSFQDNVPDLDIRVDTQPSSMQVHPAAADLSVLLGSGDWTGLETVRLFDRQVVVVCAPALKTGLGRKAVPDLDGKALIVHESRPRAWADWAEAVGVSRPTPSNLFRFDSMSAVVRAAEEGLGFALMSWPLGKQWVSSRRLVQVGNNIVDTGESFFLAYRPDEAEQPGLVPLIDWLVAEFCGYA